MFVIGTVLRLKAEWLFFFFFFSHSTFQEGFAPPEDEDLDEQAHLDQDEYWSVTFLTSNFTILPFLFLFLFFLPSFVFYSLHTYSPSSLLSVFLFLSSSLVYMFVSPPCPPTYYYSMHYYSASSFAAPPCLFLHSDNNSNVWHIPVISAWVTEVEPNLARRSLRQI